MQPRYPTARSWVLFALPAALALGACDRSPTEPVAGPEGLEAAKGAGGPKPSAALIAFVANHEIPTGAIYTIRTDGTGLRRVTSPADGQNETHPNFSPGNQKLVFGRYLGAGVRELFVVNLKNRQVSQLTSFGAQTSQPVYSPDGSRVAFVSNKDGQGDLYVMNADGTNVVRLTNTPEWENSPTWTPNGQMIAFGVRPGSGSWPSQIVGLDLNTHQTQVLVDCPQDSCSSPRWSRTSGELIYEFDASAQFDLPSLRRRSIATNIDMPYENQGINFAGEWSPDGASFVFASTRDRPELDGYDLFIRTGQGPATRLTYLPQVAFQATWSR